jgi:poly(ADP-ribose) glycohydrolase ARH3
MSAVPSVDQFLGCLLGQAVGDGLGAPFEGLPAESIYWGYAWTGDLIQNPSGETLYYTDDTQMMIGIAETLAEHSRIIEEPLCQAFVANYHPDRGYGPGARLVLEAMAQGHDWRMAREYFPGGSLGNGAAMRVAPVGLLFCDDLDRVWEEARLSALPTHLHPLGIEGAQLLAAAVALAVREPVFDRKGFYRELFTRAQQDEFRWQLSAAARLGPGDTVSFLGNGVEAHRSVVTAIACFAASPGSYEDTVSRAIGQGHDTDTLGAMAGALSGAHLGAGAIPGHLLDKLEDDHKGRTYLRQLATRMHEAYRGQRQP